MNMQNSNLYLSIVNIKRINWKIC